jgi:hypothetical protein
MSKNNNSDLNAKTNVVELTQAELDSVTGGRIIGLGGGRVGVGAQVIKVLADGWRAFKNNRIPEEDNGGS